MNKTISIIVPVYKTEQYLPECIESILSQTYRDLDIILIDDGSPDNSGKICDEYADKDGRVRVFHKENQGLSSVRNFGLEKAREKNSEYIGFIDSDDWIEPEMYESLLNALTGSGADIAVCRYFGQKTMGTGQQILSKNEAIIANIEGRINNTVSNKLYKTKVFENIEFPVGKNYEDLATFYRILFNAEKITVLQDEFYHWCMNPNSITHTQTMENLMGKWYAYKARYDELAVAGPGQISKENERILLGDCAKGISAIWRWANSNPKEERDKYSEKISEITRFTKEHFPPFGFSEWPLWLKANIFLAHSDSEISFAISYLMIRVYRAIFPYKYKQELRLSRSVTRNCSGRHTADKIKKEKR